MTGVLFKETGPVVEARWNPDLKSKDLSESGVMMGKMKHISWSLKLKVFSMKEQSDLQALKEQRAALRSELRMKVFTSGEEEYEHLLLHLKAYDTNSSKPKKTM